MKNSYERVEELRKKHPNESTSALCKRAKCSDAAYYSQRRKADAPKLGRPRGKYKKMTVEAQPSSDGLVRVLIGTPAQIREVLQ